MGNMFQKNLLPKPLHCHVFEQTRCYSRRDSAAAGASRVESGAHASRNQVYDSLSVTVRVMFDHTPSVDGELTIHVGDEIKDVRPTFGRWWKGRLNDEWGSIPSPYVTIVQVEPWWKYWWRRCWKQREVVSVVGNHKIPRRNDLITVQGHAHALKLTYRRGWSCEKCFCSYGYTESYYCDDCGYDVCLDCIYISGKGQIWDCVSFFSPYIEFEAVEFGSIIDDEWQVASINQVNLNMEKVRTALLDKKWEVCGLVDGSVTGFAYGFEIGHEVKEQKYQLIMRGAISEIDSVIERNRKINKNHIEEKLSKKRDDGASDGELPPDDFEELRTFDEEFRRELSSIITKLEHWNDGSSYLVIGGSVIEGAAISRYFQPKVDGGSESKNREVELDLNIVLAEIPKHLKPLVEQVPNKPINAVIKCDDALTNLVSNDYKEYIQRAGHEGYLNSYVIKEAAASIVKTAKQEESWLKGLVAMAKDKDISDVNFNWAAEFGKPTAAADIEIKVEQEYFVNVSLDLSIMFRVEWFPEVAKEWLTRERAWPTQEDIDILTRYSYLISKPSDAEKNNPKTTEFSYSFHHIETKLSQLRTPQQQRIYMKFKSLIYRYIKPLDADIPSFYGKSIMIWRQERHAPDDGFWSDDATALRGLFNDFIVAVESDSLPYYFVPRFNIMKLAPHTKKKVIGRLCGLRDDPVCNLEDFPVEECLRFYSDIHNDAKQINKIMDIMSTQDYSGYERMGEDQFAALKHKLGQSSHELPQSTGDHSRDGARSFVGRSFEINEIHTIMTARDRDHRAVLVHGIAGVGKTQLVRQYISRYSNCYPRHFWINCSTEYSVTRKFVEIASDAGIPTTDDDGVPLETAQLINHVFRSVRDKPTLFVLDNINFNQVFCNWFNDTESGPACTPFLVATSQSNACPSYFYQLKLTPLKENDALIYLKENLPDEVDDEGFKTNIRYNGCLPLALQVTVACLKKRDMRISDLNEVINRESALVDDLVYKLFPPNYGKALYATLNYCIGNVLNGENRTAVNILCIIAFMDGLQVDREILMEYCKSLHELNRGLEDLLINYLVQEDGESRLSMHSLLQLVLRNQLVVGKRASKYLRTLFGMISSFVAKNSPGGHVTLAMWECTSRAAHVL